MPATFQRQVEDLLFQLSAVPFLDRLQAIDPEGFASDIHHQVIVEAGRLAADRIAPVNAASDVPGARLIDGRVVMPDAVRPAWQAFVDGGWPSLALPQDIGGQGLPLLLQTACDELWNRACPALMMLPPLGRNGAVLLDEWASDDIKQAWLPRLASGEWACTICISEPDAGSDVGRIRTRAARDEQGVWRISGEKCWISFGDHDLTSRIGHCMIARTSDEPGVRGLSLFLVPNVLDDGTANAIRVHRIEEKMGLHGSPTCVLGFEGAFGHLVGTQGRGLNQLFTMMMRMRLYTGPQGCGIAAGAAEVALDYASERLQGGRPDAPPVPIVEHVDVRRQLLEMQARVAVARGMTLASAAALDLADRETDEEARGRARRFIEWLLPITKDFAGRAGFDVASAAIQVLGGAGYTAEWPVEQAARDARVFSIFEGTTGIQANDMLHRRLWRDGGEGLRLFLSLAREETGDDGAEAAALDTILDAVEIVSAGLAEMRNDIPRAEMAAVAYLDLCSLAVASWIALRLIRRTDGSPAGERQAHSARYWLKVAPNRAQALAAEALADNDRLALFPAIAAG